MGATVYVNDRSVVHKKSDGKSIAFPDVCLSPPPAPTGPVPLPYPNTAMSSDTDEGASTVAADGAPVALKGQSHFKTSTGDEAGNQGGNVVTHKTKGKAFFMNASMDVTIEGAQVPRHGDPMAHNCSCAPYAGIAPAYIDLLTTAMEHTDCEDVYKRNVHGRDSEGRRTPNDEQREGVRGLLSDQATESQPAGTVICWECQEPTANPVADHQPPLVLTYYRGGCHDEEEMQDAAGTTDVRSEPPEPPDETPCIVPHCPDCSDRQRNSMNQLSRDARAAQGF
jgi:uncharacterized Zn-binding protein involved in type VI secretion